MPYICVCISIVHVSASAIVYVSVPGFLSGRVCICMNPRVRIRPIIRGLSRPSPSPQRHGGVAAVLVVAADSDTPPQGPRGAGFPSPALLGGWRAGLRQRLGAFRLAAPGLKRLFGQQNWPGGLQVLRQRPHARPRADSLPALSACCARLAPFYVRLHGSPGFAMYGPI